LALNIVKYKTQLSLTPRSALPTNPSGVPVMKPTVTQPLKPLPQDVLLFFHQILDQARDIILVVQSDGKILYANRAAALAYEYSVEELLTLTVTDLRAPETERSARKQLEGSLSTGTLYRTLHRRRSGEIFPVEVSAKRLEFADIKAGVAILRDVTHATLIEQSLSESEQRQHNLNEELIAANEELIAINEELTASEEELRAQFITLLEKEAEIRRQNAILASLHETAMGLMDRRDPNELLSMIVTGATQLIGTSHGFIYILDKTRRLFRRTQGTGIYSQDLGREISAGQGVVGLVQKTGQPAIINNYQDWRRQHPESVQFAEINAVIQIPLKSGTEVIGTIGLSYCREQKTFTNEEVDRLSRFAELASIALSNSLLLDSYKQELAERLAAELSLQKSQTTKQAMAQAIPDLMFILRSDGVILDYKAGTEPTLVPPSQFIGRSLLETLPSGLGQAALLQMKRALETGSVQSFEYELEINGKPEYYEARLIRSGDDEVLAICRNISERTLMETQLKHLSLHDALTGLYNRAFFEEEMRRLEKQRDGAAGLLICDVDGLKIVNDALGHAAGDTILRDVAQIVRRSFRPGDVIARIGGDEFVVLLNTNSIKIFEQATRRIKQQIAAYNAKNPMPLSLSSGFAVSRRTPPDMTALFKEADNNMYRQKLHQKLSARSTIVQGLIKALEARDFITEGHGDRMQKLAEAFARKLGLPERSLADLRLFAQFHDIGKVGIPDGILFKPGKLTEDEWKTMKQHCEIGHRIAMATPDLEPIADWILRHQEWWNGKGYPTGQKGEAIPLECRILAIVDAYDAMTHDRPYRQGMESARAVDELKRCAGTQFDPALVSHFISLLSQAEVQ
jgi:diguanylate cyclase (GGDEF)-like protein/PAS domain S-box-containing protein